MKNFKILALLALLSIALGCSNPKPKDRDQIIAADSVRIKTRLREVLSKIKKPNGDSVHGYEFGLQSEDGNEVFRIKDQFEK